MYETSVVMAYLASNPDEADRFVKYATIERKKLGAQFKNSGLGFDHPEHTVMFEEIEEEYLENADQFAEKVCSHCKQKPMPNWTKLSIEAMAKRAGHNLEQVYVTSYSSTTKKVHVSPLSVARYVEVDSEGQASFELPKSPEEADYAVYHAHWLLITVLEVQDKYFKLDLDESLRRHDDQIAAIWSDKHR